MHTDNLRHRRALARTTRAATTLAFALIASASAPPRAQVARLRTHVAQAAQSQRVAEPQDDEVISVNADLVVLNVTATDSHGAYVHGLRRDDFKVLEDGREQQITNFSEEETPFAVALLLDVSGSMEGRITLARSAAIRFLDALRENDVAAVYSFHSRVERVQDFSGDRDLTPRAFGLHAKGQTVLNDAIVEASKALAARPEKRRAILVLSDGADNLSRASTDKALNAALAAGATIYTVDMGESAEGGSRTIEGVASAAALKSFAGKTGGRYLTTQGGETLREAFAQIAEELSNQYTVGYRPSNHTRDNRWRAVEVDVARSGVNARTRRGYRLGKG